MSLRQRMYEGSDAHKLDTIEMRIQFAEQCINAVDERKNEAVYNALSHLAILPELQIDIREYESMRILPESRRLNTDAYMLAKNMLAEAYVLRDTVLRERYAPG